MKLQFLSRLFMFSACSLSVLLLPGCGSGSNDPGDELVPVSGTVIMDGSPLSNASVRFEPESGQAGSTYFGVTNESGEYVLKNRHGREGCKVGSFKVVVSKFAKPDGSPIGEDEDAITSGAIEFLPPKFSSSDKTELKAEVPDGGKTFDFTVEGKK